MRVLAPAKINLSLRVGPRRADGYHPLVSWMVTVGLFDKLEFEPSRQAGLSLQCDRADLPCDQGNLIVRAASLVSQCGRAPGTHSPPGAAGKLEKRIPVGAGLGGGSSDGARTLLALNALWKLSLSRRTLHELAAQLGSDVPFFLHEPSAICAGRGELVQPAPPPLLARWGVLILPALFLSTARVYQRFDAMALGSSDAANARPDREQLTGLSANDLLPRLVNDLEPAAFDLAPELGRLRDSAQAALSRVVRMSGSGSSLFTLFDHEHEARAAAERLGAALEVRCETVRIAPELPDDLNKLPS